jgi:hypothetical protein
MIKILFATWRLSSEDSKMFWPLIVVVAATAPKCQTTPLPFHHRKVSITYRLKQFFSLASPSFSFRTIKPLTIFSRVILTQPLRRDLRYAIFSVAFDEMPANECYFE